jgi:hypothetical protein
MKKHYRYENDCLNCGTILEGKYCHKCGQENLELKENFDHMMSHAISDYFHFDHLFFHTLKPLLFKPGYLTNEYMAGRRAQYLHPVKMYIFISIVYFLLLFQGVYQATKVNNTNGKPVNNEKAIDSAKKVIANNPYIDSKTKKTIENRLNKSKEVTKYGPVSITEASDEKADNKWFHLTTDDTTYQQYLTSQQKLPEEEQDGFFEKNYNKKVFDYKVKYGSRAKEVFEDEFKHNIPKMMFLLLPLFALILKIAFWKNKKYYVEHMIYTFHLHCFLFLFLGVIILLQMIIPGSWQVVSGWLTFLAVIYIMWYIYRSLKVVYHRSRFRTISKIMGMSFMYLFAFSFCICVIFFITAIII